MCLLVGYGLRPNPPYKALNYLRLSALICVL